MHFHHNIQKPSQPGVLSEGQARVLKALRDAGAENEWVSTKQVQAHLTINCKNGFQELEKLQFNLRPLGLRLRYHATKWKLELR